MRGNRGFPMNRSKNSEAKGKECGANGSREPNCVDCASAGIHL